MINPHINIDKYSNAAFRSTKELYAYARKKIINCAQKENKEYLIIANTKTNKLISVFNVDVCFILFLSSLLFEIYVLHLYRVMFVLKSCTVLLYYFTWFYSTPEVFSNFY